MDSPAPSPERGLSQVFEEDPESPVRSKEEALAKARARLHQKRRQEQEEEAEVPDVPAPSEAEALATLNSRLFQLQQRLVGAPRAQRRVLKKEVDELDEKVRYKTEKPPPFFGNAVFGHPLPHALPPCC